MRILNLISVIFLPLSRTRVAKGKSITIYEILLVLLRVVVLGIAAIVLLNNYDYEHLIETFNTDYKVVNNIIAYLTMLIPLLAIAVLLRNLNVKDNTGLVILGFAVAFIIYATTKSPYITLLISSLMAIGLASLIPNDNEVKSEIKTEKKGVGEKWW